MQIQPQAHVHPQPCSHILHTLQQPPRSIACTSASEPLLGVRHHTLTSPTGRSARHLDQGRRVRNNRWRAHRVVQSVQQARASFSKRRGAARGESTCYSLSTQRTPCEQSSVDRVPTVDRRSRQASVSRRASGPSMCKPSLPSHHCQAITANPSLPTHHCQVHWTSGVLDDELGIVGRHTGASCPTRQRHRRHGPTCGATQGRTGARDALVADVVQRRTQSTTIGANTHVLVDGDTEGGRGEVRWWRPSTAQVARGRCVAHAATRPRPPVSHASKATSEPRVQDPPVSHASKTHQ